ncbi:MAG: peptidoglycan DD-metalloendopeptidase family protein [Rhodanobacter sp.]|jgi:lipoprotein NlpD|nr:peptidoglycan DD-metalloendopeptidase family protein [Rhodanobacter sp.]
MKRWFEIAVPTLVALLLAACASTGPSYEEDDDLDMPQPAGAHPPGAKTYRIQRGDTLYSIAFRHGLDYRDLAAWNQIDAPYTIYAGQELRVTPTRGMPPRTAAASASNDDTSVVVALPADMSPNASSTALASTQKNAPPPGPAPAPTPFEDVPPQDADTHTAVEQNPSPPAQQPSPTSAPASKPAAPPPAQQPSPASTPASKPAAPPPAQQPPAASNPPPVQQPPVPPSPPPASASVVSGGIAWHWPANGQVVAPFVAGDQTRQGIDISGKAGDPVRAAADGVVVYSGNGLLGYGELIIVKHNPAFLSAYGHNRKRLVKEGDHVAAGQLIAEMGSSSASRDSLHFEIRRNGKPTNPAEYLPRH